MATNFWESDAVVKSENQWWSKDPEAGAAKKEESSFLRQVADVPLSIGRGAATGVRLIADAFGAGSGVSETIKGAEGYLASLMSAQAKNDEREIARIMKDAEDKGMGEQVKAAFQAFATAPVDLISQGLGTAAPALVGLLGGKVLGAGALGARAIGMGVGAGMGAGTAKSAIYDATKEELLKAGLPEAQAEEKAQLAQSYGGKNLDQILLSTGLGAFASGTGLESSIKNIVFKAGAKDAAQEVAKKGALQTAKNLTGKAALEGVPEIAQGSQEQLAQNIALQREGFDVPTMRGVVGAGALEGLAGAGLGVAGGAFESSARSQARAEAQRILEEEDKARVAAEQAEAKRLADAERARLEAEAAEKAAIPPLALGSEGVFTPVALPDGSVAMTREELAQYEEQQFEKKYAAQEADKKPTLALGAAEPFKPVVFPDGSVATTPEEVAQYEEQQFEGKYKPQAVPPAPVFKEEPVGKSITGAKPQLGARPAGGELAGMISGRREAEAAKAEIPLVDDYAFLQKEKQRLLQQDQTPDTKKLIGRIDERIGEVLKRDIERQRADAEAAKTSVFAQEKLPEVESRDVVVGGEELATAQAKQQFPETVIDRKEKQSLARMERMREQPAPPESDADKKIMELEKERGKIKSANLYNQLIGKLAWKEVNDISPDIGKNLRIKGGRGGAELADMVSDGMLNDYLPPDKRPGSITFDEQEATEYIKDKLRNKDHLTFDASIQARQLDDQIDKMRKEADAPRMAEYDLSDVEPGEAATVERAAGDQAVVESTDQIRYKRSTGKIGIGKQAVQDTVDTVKARWANAPEVVVAENMDDPVIPQEVRDHNKAAVAKGAKGSPQGFYYKGKAYVIADSIGSTNEAVEALMHEALGHFGLRGVFGPKMEAVLRDVIKNRRAEVEGKAEQYGLDPKNDADMLEAAEEVLAVMAQTKPGLPFVKRALVIIRDFLRGLGFNIKMSDADIIQKYILPARAFVESGKGRPTEGKPAAMRGEAPKTGPGTAAFNRWSDGLPVHESYEDRSSDRGIYKLFHMTTADFSEFIPGGLNPMDSGPAIFLSTNPSAGSATFRVGSEQRGFREGARTMPVYAKLKSPLVVDSKEMLDFARESFADGSREFPQLISKETVDALKSEGYDSVIFDGNGVGWRNAENEILVFDPTQIKSATGNIGTYDPENADIRYQRENIKGQPVLAQWTTPTDTKLYGETTKDDIIYSLQNKMIDTKRVVDAISATAGKIMAKWNPYLQEELFHGRTAKQTADFLKKELRPLMQDMSTRGVNIKDFEEYLHNRHAEDYNKHVAKIGGMSDGGSGIKTADARAYLAGLTPQQKTDFEALAKKMDAINKATREVLVSSGYETRQTINQWEKTFPFYVPLKRDEAKLDYAYTAGGLGTGQGFDVRGKFSRSATGSEKDVVNILANSALQRERAIIKAEKNRVAQAMFGLALQSPNPDFWLPIDPMAEVDPSAAQDLLSFGLSQQDLDFLMKEPRQKAVDKSSGQVVERINATLRDNENVMSMRFNGRDRYVFFNPNNPRSKRMISSLKNLDADQLGPILGNLSKITRWFASVNTQYNPIFGAYNFLRDVQGAALQLSDTPLAKDRKAVVAGTLPALKGIYSALRAERDGTAVNTPWATLWNEFQEEGGQTGFRDQFSRSQERAEALEKELKMVTEGKLKSAGRGMLNWLSDYNDSMENAIRLSAYKTARDKFVAQKQAQGMSAASAMEEAKQEAASIAKNLTVNFNRKGQIAVQAGALYAFFNAAVQGTTRLAQTLRGPAGKKIMAGGLLLGTMQAALLAAAGFDDEEPPEFVRERNLILPIGGDKYLTFPMPLGYHVIPSTSRIITEWALSGFKDTPDRIASLTGMYLEAFNPIGNAGWSAQTLAPTFADPIVALTENRDWTGKPIARKDFSSLDPTPGYTRAKDTASWFSTQLAKYLNYASGGTEFKPGTLSPTPDQIDYLIGQVTGGIGRELLKVEQTAIKTATGEELPPYKIPVVGRFYGETKSSAAESSRFYKNLTELNEHENEIKGRRESRQPVADYLKDNPEARLAPMARNTYSDIQKLRKRKEQLLERDAPRESIKQVEAMITKKMQAFNARVEAMKE